MACAQAVRAGKASLDAVEKILQDWQKKGLLHQDEIAAAQAEQERRQEKIAAMHAAAGVKKRITRADEALYQKFLDDGFGEDVIAFAASCAYGMASPLKAMDAILSRWKQAGAMSLTAAKEQNEQFRAGRQKRGGASAIDEREYAPGELDAKVYDPIDEILRGQKEGDMQ